MKRLLAVAIGLAVGAGGAALFMARGDEHTGCAAFIPVEDTPLVAHAGGGLPDRTYANDRAAMDLAAAHGFELIELDFLERDGRLTIGHDGMAESSLTLAELMDWLDEHPNVTIVTDIKTDNLSGLSKLKAAAGPRLDRFVPQIYHPAQFAPVRQLGFAEQILTIYRLPAGAEWIEAANALPLRAVTVPVDRREQAAGVRHPVFLHTVNRPMAGYGLYTDCLVPA